MAKFTAVTMKGAPLVTVLAPSYKEAEEVVEKELSANEGRLPALRQWRRGGKKLIEDRSDVVRRSWVTRKTLYANGFRASGAA